MEGLIKVYKDNSDVRNTIIEVVEASVVNKIRNPVSYTHLTLPTSDLV